MDAVIRNYFGNLIKNWTKTHHLILTKNAVKQRKLKKRCQTHAIDFKLIQCFFLHMILYETCELPTTWHYVTHGNSNLVVIGALSFISYCVFRASLSDPYPIASYSANILAWQMGRYLSILILEWYSFCSEGNVDLDLLRSIA